MQRAASSASSAPISATSSPSGPGPGPPPGPGSDALAAALVPLLSHREAEARDTSAQVLAAVLLAAEAQSSQGGSSSSSAAAVQLLPNLSRSNAKAHARVSHFLDEGRHRGDHLPTPTSAALAAAVAATAARAAPSAVNATSSRRPSSAATGHRATGAAVAVVSSGLQAEEEEEVKRGGGGEASIPTSRRSPRPAAPSPSPSPADGAAREKLVQMWGPVELVLRQPPTSPAALDRLATSAAAGACICSRTCVPNSGAVINAFNEQYVNRPLRLKLANS